MSRSSNKRSSGSAANNEVQALFKKGGKVTAADYARLSAKYGDAELVSRIQAKFQETHYEVTKKAKKFAALIRKKYSDSNLPLHVLLEKALFYKKKHNMNDAEFAEFKRITETELYGKDSPDVVIPNTNMMKVLGTITTDLKAFQMKVTDADQRNLESIVQIHRSSRPLHAQVMLQSFQYRDCDPESLTGTYRRDLNQKPGEHVHPVVAALFFPKIETLENHFLYSNIAGIVNARKNKHQLKTRPDYELFYNLVTDPNDIVCDNKSPVSDLLARVNLQNQVWNSVLHLRNGQYYNGSFREFIATVDYCKLNKHDNPDLIYGRHDGTVIKRLISAFSFRPTVVATTPYIQQFSLNPYHQNVRPSVRQVPMVNLRLNTSLNENAPVHLSDALEQTQVFLEEGRLVPRHTSLIYSRGVLMFYVDRRAHRLRLGNDPSTGYFNLSRMPVAVAGFERLNSRQVNFDPEIRIRDDVYQLRSVVVSEINRNDVNGENLVVGSSAIVMCHPDSNATPPRYEYECFHYDPLGVVETGVGSNGERLQNAPVTVIPYGTGVLAEGNSFYEMASKRGTVFLYQNVKDETQGLIHY